MTLDIQPFKQFTSRFEGSINNFYLDTHGNVTVGVGHLVSSRDAAVSLNLVDKLTLEPACDVEKADEYSRVLRSEAAHNATYYIRLCHLQMLPAEIDKLFTADITGVASRVLSQFGALPQPAAVALVDLAFNVGYAGIYKWPRLIDAIKRQDWAGAAVECQSTKTGHVRNEARRLCYAVTGYGGTPMVDLA